MNRLHDWDLHLEAFVQARLRMPFAWGRNDCALFTADAVQAMTGKRLCEELRGHATARQALRVLAEVGGVRGVAARALDEPIPLLMAKVGDVVIIEVGKREALAICNGGTAIAPGPAGMVAVPMAHARAAWRVG